MSDLGPELFAWTVLAVAVAGVGSPSWLRDTGPKRDDAAAEHDLATVALPPTRELYPGVSDAHLLTECRMVDTPGGPAPLRDWLRHLAGSGVWSLVVARFYSRAGADPRIADYFAGADIQQVQRHFLAALMILTGQGETVGVVRRLHNAHAHVCNARGEQITADTWDVVIGILAEVLAELGTPLATLVALATTIGPIRAAIVTVSEVPAR